MAFTIRNFIYDSGFSGMTLLTCLQEIDRPIVSVNVIDNPDVTSWVESGQLVLTTGYFFSNDPNLQTNVIMNLRSTGCSALCIKMKRFFPEVPVTIIKTAELAGLPIIDLPLEYTFSDITQRVHDKLNHSQLQKIQQEQELLHSLINAFQSKYSLPNCLRLLSDYLSTSLFIVDIQFQCHFYFLRPQDGLQLSIANQMKLEPQGCKNTLLSSGEAVRMAIKINSEERNAVLIPFRDQLHFLCVPEEDPILPLELIQRAMQLFHFPQDHLSKISTNLSSYYADFFHFLLSEDKNQSNRNEICEYYGYPHCKAQLCALFSLRHGLEANQLQPQIAFLKKRMQDYSFKPSTFFLASYQRQICLFFHSAAPNCYQTAMQCAEDFQKEFGSAFIAGVSQLIWGDREIVGAYRQAAFLLSLSNVFPAKRTFFFNDYILFWNISELPSDQKQNIYRDTVKPLVDYDTKNNTELLATLLQYFDAQFNASLASKQLYIHRNTFLKRLLKISELVPFDINNINSLLSLYYGICIYLLGQY